MAARDPLSRLISPWKKSSGPFPRMKTSGFHGRCASVIASLRSSRLFVHSLLSHADDHQPGQSAAVALAPALSLCANASWASVA
jgi:hypothetical protein